MTYPSRRQYKYAKKRYRILNWACYERGLRQRGDVTVWFSQGAIKAWREPPRGRPGGQRIYARAAIETALTVRMVFGLALRQAEGFLRSLGQQLRLNIPTPDHTTHSRRARMLGKIRLATQLSAGPLHILVDSTGLSVHTGNQRKPPDRRLWRKLHLSVDSADGQITATELTASGTHDSTAVATLLQGNDAPVASFIADGAYDTEHVYAILAQHAQQQGRAMEPLDFITRLVATIPPPRFHTLRFHGVLAPHSTLRPLVAPKPPAAARAAPLQLSLFELPKTKHRGTALGRPDRATLQRQTLLGAAAAPCVRSRCHALCSVQGPHALATVLHHAPGHRTGHGACRCRPSEKVVIPLQSSV